MLKMLYMLYLLNIIFIELSFVTFSPLIYISVVVETLDKVVVDDDEKFFLLLQ